MPYNNYLFTQLSAGGGIAREPRQGGRRGRLELAKVAERRQVLGVAKHLVKELPVVARLGDAVVPVARVLRKGRPVAASLSHVGDAPTAGSNPKVVPGGVALALVGDDGEGLAIGVNVVLVEADAGAPLDLFVKRRSRAEEATALELRVVVGKEASKVVPRDGKSHYC